MYPSNLKFKKYHKANVNFLSMTEQKVFFGTSRQLIERIDSLDEKWFVEVYIIKYYFFGIELFAQKKEIVKRTQENTASLKAVQ